MPKSKTCSRAALTLLSALVVFRVLYISMHRYEHGQFWPSLREGSHTHIGKGEGLGFNINVPLNQVSLHFGPSLPRVWGGGGSAWRGG